LYNYIRFYTKIYHMIIDTLREQWLSENEAKTYLAVLSLWIATISEIARKLNERRENVYYTLENLQKKWYISCITKNKVNNYTALDPRELHEKVQNKANNLLANIPELLALMPKIWWKMSVNLYEWLEWFKIAYEHVVLSSKYMADDEYFLWFVWTQHINKALERYLVNERVPWRLKFTTKTRAIIDKKSIKHQSGSYSDYHETTHETLIIDDPFFSISNEIIIHWKDEVSVMMYWDDDLSAMIVKSQTLHDTLKSLFYLVRNSYKKETPQKKIHRSLKPRRKNLNR